MIAPGSRRPLAVFVCVFVSCSTLFLAACRFFRPTSAETAPATSSSSQASAPAIERLKAAVALARPLLSAAGLVCLALPPDDRLSCQTAISALREALGLAEGLISTAEACGEGDQRCIEQVAQQAEEQIERLERLQADIEQLAAQAGVDARRIAVDASSSQAGASGEPR